mmetsp:Transcript_29477/g.44740  ORF Transcript_29477/g.44740 Transcript_29477/m.44740 type:complete len:115 (-) Transcript_29477:24-368(-)
MTFKGRVLGINRHGVAKMKDSTLMLASFEQTTDHLYNAAAQCKKDDITGVSESIITGSLAPVGTGSFQLIHDDKTDLKPVTQQQFDKWKKGSSKLASLEKKLGYLDAYDCQMTQ